MHAVSQIFYPVVVLIDRRIRRMRIPPPSIFSEGIDHQHHVRIIKRNEVFVVNIVFVFTKDLGNPHPPIIPTLNSGHGGLLTFVIDGHPVVPTIYPEFA